MCSTQPETPSSGSEGIVSPERSVAARERSRWTVTVVDARQEGRQVPVACAQEQAPSELRDPRRISRRIFAPRGLTDVMKALMKAQETHELVRRAQRGDRDAFDELADAHRARIRSLVHCRMGAHLKRISEVDDVLQETFLRAFRSIDGFRWNGEDSLARWLGGIAEHVLLWLSRRYDQGHRISLGRDLFTTGISPSGALRREERFDRLQESLSRLSSDHRQVIFLARVEGLRIKDIALRMNRSPDAVTHLLSRALRALRSSFGDTESLSLPPRSLTEEGGEDEERNHPSP